LGQSFAGVCENDSDKKPDTENTKEKGYRNMDAVETLEIVGDWQARDLPDRFLVEPSQVDEVMIQQLKAESKVLEESEKISQMIICDLPN
jgi:hypothetical protein